MEAYQQLEISWAEFNDLDPEGMVCCSSGTAALHLGLEALQLPLGSKVIVPDFTMVACPRAVALAGLEPIFVDCNDRLLMAWDASAKVYGTPAEPLSAVMTVHIYGRCIDMGEVHGYGRFVCGNNPIPVIEDLAEAHGVKPHPQTDAAAWSFFVNKHVHGEEGGAVWFRNPQHAVLARQLRCVGFTDAHDYQHIPRGMNYRLANTLARLVLDNLLLFEEESKHRRHAEREIERVCPAEWRMPPRDATWVYDFRVPGMTKECQDEAVAALKLAGIAARHGFYPMSLQQEFSSCRRVGGENSVRASREVIYVPLKESSLPTFEIVRSVVSCPAKSVY